MRIALVFPSYNLIKEAYGSKKQIKSGNLPPLGLGYLAGALEQKGHTVKIIDASAMGIGFNTTIGILKEFGPDFIGIAANNAVAKNALFLAGKAKEELNVPVILGGPHPSCFPEECLNTKGVDYIILGEGEKTFPELIDKISAKKEIKAIPGIGYKERGKAKFTVQTGPIMALDELPPIAWHLFDFKLYTPLPNQYRRLPAVNYITSRGCPWRKCAFCYQSGIMSQVYRRHSPERVIEDIKLLMHKYGMKEISFWDDNFLINENWIKRFCDLLKENKLDLAWSCYGKVSTPTEEMLKRVAEAGCWSVFYGIESGNQDLLDGINKGITLDQVRRTIKLTHKYGMETRGSFMLAIPGETPEKAEKTIKFAIALDLDYAQFLPTYPEYGTPLYDLAMKTGKIVKGYHGRTKAAYVPEGYKDGKQVEYYVKKAYSKFYFRPHYVWKVLKKIKSFNDFKKYFEGLKFMIGLTN
ncbi:MAG: radical SAM protein [Candidatus Woesearchaeota archaeon]|nr:radical SAM protein [Candidatus Woesearchaeota archaeon]